MKLSTPFKKLGDIDVSAFDVLLDPSHPYWPRQEDDIRSNLFETHKATTSILFRWTPRDNWPKLSIEEREAWRGLSSDVTELWSAAAALADLPADRPPINLMLARLKPGGSIERHFDRHPFFAWARRIHVPLSVPYGCIFECGGEKLHARRGQAFELSNRDMHGVDNPTSEPRFHFVMDFAP